MIGVKPYNKEAEKEISGLTKGQLREYCQEYEQPLIGMTFENLLLLNEGLITTYSADKTIEYVQKALKGIPLLIRKTETNNGPCIIATIPTIGSNFNIICNLMNACGWFLGHPKYNSENYPKNVLATLQFEPKFQPQSRDVLGNEKFLLHITQAKNVPKIKRIGLVPSSKNQMFNYPDRIYLIKGGVHMSKIIGLAGMLCYVNKNEDYKNGIAIKEDYSVLKIDVAKIPEKTKFAIDPNFADGVYTTDNIPPSAIVSEEKFTITNQILNNLFGNNEN